jgi:hypothetical protein
VGKSRSDENVNQDWFKAIINLAGDLTIDAARSYLSDSLRPVRHLQHDISSEFEASTRLFQPRSSGNQDVIDPDHP